MEVNKNENRGGGREATPEEVLKFVRSDEFIYQRDKQT